MKRDWKIENTGGGCQWLRKGRMAITDGDAGLPKKGEPCLLLVLDSDGDYDETMPTVKFPSLESAFAHLEASERIYGSEIKSARRRIKQLERCLEAVRSLAVDRWETAVRTEGADLTSDDVRLLDRIATRINRTL